MSRARRFLHQVQAQSWDVNETTAMEKPNPVVQSPGLQRRTVCVSVFASAFASASASMSASASASASMSMSAAASTSASKDSFM